VLFFVAMTVAAYGLVVRRDHGAGLLPDRLGPARGGRLLGGPYGLAWRLQRGLLVGWLIAFTLLGFVFGNIATNVGAFTDSPAALAMIQKLGGVKALTDAFMSTELGFVAVILSVYGIQVVLRLRSEESELRAESVLATGVSRYSWAWSHIVIALVGTAVVITAAGLAAGLSYSAQTGQASDVGRVLLAALVRLPAVWVLAAIAAAAFGLAPRAAVIGWAALVAFLLLGELGPLFELPQSVMNLSPYAHVPRLPGSSLTATPLVALTLLAAALIGAGLVGLRRRDMPVT
jgi:ABC-2 type transport system permease protein